MAVTVPAAFAEVAAGGELRRRLLRNFDRLETEIFQPARAFHGNNGWPGDKEGRLVLALVLLAQSTQREPRYLQEMLRQYPRHMNVQGVFGAPPAAECLNEQQLAGHGWVLRGLCEHHLCFRDQASLDLIEKIVKHLVLPTKGAHSAYPIEPAQRVQTGAHCGSAAQQIGRWQLSSDTGCDFIFMDGVAQAYEILRTDALREIVEEMIARFLQMDLVAIKAQTHASLTGMRALLRHYALTGRTELLHAVEWRYRQYRAFGMTENFCNWNWFGRPTWTEPCALVDSLQVALSLWAATQRHEYLEDAHLIYFNALGHAQRRNGGFGCDTCVGLTQPADATSGTPFGFSPFVRISAEEAYWCCSMRGAEGLARAAQFAYCAGPGMLCLPFFGDSTGTFKLGAGTLKVRQTSRYPAQGGAKLEVLEAPGGSAPFELRFFAPAWTAGHRVARNGAELAASAQDGFVIARTPLAKGDALEFTFVLVTGGQRPLNAGTPGGYGTFRHGPLLLACETGAEALLAPGAELEAAGEAAYRVKGTEIRLAPTNDMLDRDIVKETYSRQLLFRSRGS